MEVKLEFEKYRTVALDTNIFIYHFYEYPKFSQSANKIFTLLSENKLKAVTSIVTLIELLSIKAEPGKIKKLEEVFLETPNLTVSEIDFQVARDAAKIRRKYGFRIPDCLQLACAIKDRAKVFITNDKKLKNFKAIKVVLLNEI